MTAATNRMRLAGVGALMGLATALVVGRVMVALLYGVSPVDPVTLVAASGIRLAVGVDICAVFEEDVRDLEVTTDNGHASAPSSVSRPRHTWPKSGAREWRRRVSARP
jgi:hypothetical protein